MVVIVEANINHYDDREWPHGRAQPGPGKRDFSSCCDLVRIGRGEPVKGKSDAFIRVKIRALCNKNYFRAD